MDFSHRRNLSCMGNHVRAIYEEIHKHFFHIWTSLTDIIYIISKSRVSSMSITCLHYERNDIDIKCKHLFIIFWCKHVIEHVTVSFLKHYTSFFNGLRKDVKVDTYETQMLIIYFWDSLTSLWINNGLRNSKKKKKRV